MAVQPTKNILLGIALGLVVFVCSNPALFATSQHPDWLVKLEERGSLEQNPSHTQWQFINNQLTAVSLVDGVLIITRPDSANQRWETLFRLAPAENRFTTFILKDLDNDQLTEIIAGTAEPGLVYIYHWQTSTNTWAGICFAKYVWSDITTLAVLNPNYKEASNFFLVQNRDGILYLLKKINLSFDLVWQSPNNWRPITTMLVMDIDADGSEEVLVVYKNGGIAILKLINNTMVSVWENYFWGKILAITSGDCNNDSLPELLFSTSQKIIYSLGYNEKHFQFKEQLNHDYTIDSLYLIPPDDKVRSNQLLATDTSGKTHLLQFDQNRKEWQEEFIVQTGRIAKLISQPATNQVYLWRNDRKVLTLDALLVPDLKLQVSNQRLRLSPQPVMIDGQLYLAPKSLQVLTGLKLVVEDDPLKYQVIIGPRNLTVPRDLKSITVNGIAVRSIAPPIIIANQLYISLPDCSGLLGLNLILNYHKKLLILN